jgi:hypothetical protein
MCTFLLNQKLVSKWKFERIKSQLISKLFNSNHNKVLVFIEPILRTVTFNSPQNEIYS